MASMKKCPDCAEMVQREARKCRYCGHMFSATPPSKAKNDDAAASGCAILAVLGIIIFLIAQCGGSGDSSSNSTSTTENVASAVVPTEPYAVRLKREVEDLKKSPRLTDTPTDKNGLLMSAVLIGARVKVYMDAPEKLSAEDKKIQAEFRRLQSAYQRDAFPKLRQAQAKIMRDLLWEHDVEVATMGGRNETLRLTGAIFAANKGIAVAQEAIADTVQILRFKQTRYEWYRGSEFTYYDLKPLPDGEIADWTGSRWVPVE